MSLEGTLGAAGSEGSGVRTQEVVDTELRRPLGRSCFFSLPPRATLWNIPPAPAPTYRERLTPCAPGENVKDPSRRGTLSPSLQLPEPRCVHLLRVTTTSSPAHHQVTRLKARAGCTARSRTLVSAAHPCPSPSSHASPTLPGTVREGGGALHSTLPALPAPAQVP